MNDLDRLHDGVTQGDGAIWFTIWSVKSGVVRNDEPDEFVVHAFGDAAAFAPAGRPSLDDCGIAGPHVRVTAVRKHSEAAAGEARNAAVRIQSGKADGDAVLDASGDVFDLQSVIGFVIDQLLLDGGADEGVFQSESAGFSDGCGWGWERLAKGIQGKQGRGQDREQEAHALSLWGCAVCHLFISGCGSELRKTNSFLSAPVN